VRLGSAHFHPGDRLDIAVGIAFEPQVGHALARLSVGPTNALAQRLAIREFLQFVMPVRVASRCWRWACSSAVFWVARRAERTHLFLALSCIAWCVCNLQYVLPRRETRAQCLVFAVAGPQCLGYVADLFVRTATRHRFSRRRIALILPPFVLSECLLALPIVPLNENVGYFLSGANLTVAALVAAHIGWWRFTRARL